MDCKKIKPLLTDYINKELSKEMEMEIKNHIDKCKNCMQEINFLNNYFNKIKNIKPINAPDDLLDKIHIRLNKKTTFKNLIKKLFIPLQIKIPFQLATAATAVLLVFLLFNPIKQLFIKQPIISEKPDEKTEIKEKKDSQKEEDKKLVKREDPVKKEKIKTKESEKVKIKKLYNVAILIVSDANETETPTIRRRGIKKEATTDVNITLDEKYKKLIEAIKRNEGKIISPVNYDNVISFNQLSIDIPEEKYKIFIEELNKIGITTIKEIEDKEKTINSYEIELNLKKQ